MSVKEAYDVWSDRYDADRNLTRDLDRLVMERMLPVFKDLKIIEIGCGTGKNTVLLSELAQSIHAIDFSEGMLAKAREKISQETVTFTVADIRAPWPCKDETANLVLCNLVLEHLENLEFFFSESARVLQTSGRIFISELHPFRQYLGKAANYQDHEQTVKIPAFVHHISDFLTAASDNNFYLIKLNEWWHQEDTQQPPRLISFLFELGQNLDTEHS
ncbi:MAG: class I SAM-dependent methyltransferase [Chroococcidiopsidaceae cyanobacterium CP_BM_RX_35]|nr:class I SAM-dependent methyltransferase [Chroococcidiopsidaceae cyanobacterium CP_BM_RX_35]